MSTVAPVPASPLVSADWLAGRLGTPSLLVVDATVLSASAPHHGYVSGHEEYVIGGHLPDAVFADILHDFSDPDGRHPFTRPSADRFALAAGALGVDNETTVVVYDSQQGQWAARLWWLFRAFGDDRVAVLDGGLTAWRLRGGPVEVGHVEPAAAVFTPAERPELWVDKAEVERIVAGEAGGALVCAAPPKRFSGEETTAGRAGHIPGSVSVPVGRIIDRESRALLGEDALREHFALVLSEDRVVTYCAGGIAATADALALTVLGHRNVAVYDGSLNEWAADAASPLVVPVARA